MVQPAPSDTVSEYVSAGTAVMSSLLVPLLQVKEYGVQVKEYGDVPPVTIRSMAPVVPPKQETGVNRVLRLNGGDWVMSTISVA